MKLKPFIMSDRIILGLNDGSQEDVLRQLIQPLVDAGNLISDPDKFIHDLLEREKQVTTVMENGVAFPHTRSEAVNRLCLTVGVAEPDGIHFNPENDAVSRLFFCIGVPAFAPTAHIPILQSLASFAREEKRVERLLGSKTPSQITRSLGNYKG